MTTDPAMQERALIAAWLEKLENLAWSFSSYVVKAAINSAEQGHWQRRDRGEVCTTKPFPMGVFDGEPWVIYYAISSGAHERLLPWEKWALARAIERGEHKDQNDG